MTVSRSTSLSPSHSARKVSSTSTTEYPHDHHILARMLDRAFAIEYARALQQGRVRPRAGHVPEFLRPRMDLHDDPSYARITAALELPGMKKEDISLKIQDGNLLVWGERRARVGVRGNGNGNRPGLGIRMSGRSSSRGSVRQRQNNISSHGAPTASNAPAPHVPDSVDNGAPSTSTSSPRPAAASSSPRPTASQSRPSAPHSNSEHPTSNSPVQEHEQQHFPVREHEHFPVQELKYGKFRRAIALPDGVQPSDIIACMNDGILTITWPRAVAGGAGAGAGAGAGVGAMVVDSDSEHGNSPRQRQSSPLHTVTPTSDLRSRVGRPSTDVAASPNPDSRSNSNSRQARERDTSSMDVEV